MSEKTGKRSLHNMLQHTLERLDLPQDILPGMAHIELVGNREILVDRHCGILEYTAETIRVATEAYTLHISGDALHLVSMNQTQLRIRGRIDGLQLQP